MQCKMLVRVKVNNLVMVRLVMAGKRMASE